LQNIQYKSHQGLELLMYFFNMVYIWFLQKFPGMKPYLESRGNKSSDGAFFEVLAISSYTFLPGILQLFKTFMKATIYCLLKFSLWNHFNLHCILEVTALLLSICGKK